MSEFLEYVKEVFEQFGSIQTRKMFGGYGIYHKGVMFGLVADETLYLKADMETVKFFEARELEPFEYNKGGKVIKTSYSMAPTEILDDPDEAVVWAQRSHEAALRSKSVAK
ncbi:MAG: transcriptional regulator [Nitrospirales bacterium]|nr:transcriptional regulator [Nitrospirales bacterium]